MRKKKKSCITCKRERVVIRIDSQSFVSEKEQNIYFSRDGDRENMYNKFNCKYVTRKYLT